MRLPLALSAVALCATGATAQIMPGMRAPTSTADAIMMAHLAPCTLAVADRPMPGLNMDLVGGEGMTQLDALPENAAAFVEAGHDTRVVAVENPGDPLWIVHDSGEHRCTIVSFTDPAVVRAEFVDTLATPDSWQPREIDADDGDADYAFEWDMGGLMELDTTISLPDGESAPVIVILQRAD